MTDVSMQRILLDTNVLLDYLLHRDDHAKMAESVMELGAKNNVTLLCASLSLKDIAYLSSSAIRRLYPDYPDGFSFCIRPFTFRKNHQAVTSDSVLKLTVFLDLW